MIRCFGNCVGVLLLVLPARAGELRLLPGDITLRGPEAKQRLIVVVVEAGNVTADLTKQVKLASSDPSIAAIDETGLLRGKGDGSAVITASLGDKQARAKVSVSDSKQPCQASFRNHVIPMMTKVGCNSGACHGALAGKGGFKLSLRGYAPEVDHFVMTRQAVGRRVDTVEPGRSLVLLKPTQVISHGGGQRLEIGSADYRVLTEWIAAGAPAPADTDCRIQRIEVFPGKAVLKPGDSVQMIVRAWYSDGHAEDVTRWGKFSSTEDLVAGVDQEGRVRVTGYGEAAISVWYANFVGTCQVTSPWPNTLDNSLFASCGRDNYIDRLVLNKLRSLHIPPSPACSDSDFIRRVYLDAAGTLPKPPEVEEFLADKNPNKRSKLIDGLLERAEFVDYWTYKWCDLFLLSTRKLSQPAMWAFYQYLRRSVADNKPWDQLAREVLTARGSTVEQGAANYFVLHKDVADLTESTSVTFLGMSVTCCRCHNHPLEKWTQDQYWSFANLFSRVAIKNGDRAGELIVQSLPKGDALHPRRGVAMPPTPLDGHQLPSDSAVDRRQYFANWLTAKDNPYFAKALVNRVWRSLMGRGLVEAEDDLRQTNPATNEELFSALADDFIGHHYDVKHLIRTILNSSAYQRSSQLLPANVADDRFYSHYLVRRLPAEVILDAYSQISGVPTSFAIYFDDKPVFQFPTGTLSLQLPDVRIASAFLDSFGRPERVQTCSCERQQDSSVSQALHLNNGQTLNDKLRAKESRVSRWVQEKIPDQQAIRKLFMLALSREPTSTESQKFLGLMIDATADKNMTRSQVLEDLFWAVLASREFVFNH
jgi:hypothetical protein